MKKGAYGMQAIQFPILENEATIGVTAPSSGVSPELHELVHKARKRLEGKGYRMQIGKTVWNQDKAKAAPALERAAEFNRLMDDEAVQLIFPPWGGELLIEMLEHVNFEKIQSKWILGYSDTSLLLLAITLKTGIATAHGTNLIDVRGESSDPTTAMWEQVLSKKRGNSVVQYSSEKYQKEWQFDNPTPHIFNLTEPTRWKSVTEENVKIEGRLLGGCIDVIRHLIGTEYGGIARFRNQFTKGEPIIWVMENCELTTTDLRRTLVQMKLAGWFKECAGIMFGRSPANGPVDNYTVEDVYNDLYEELQVPIIYDVDCGHVPPQITFINGAYVEVEVADGKGKIVQHFK